MSAFISPVAQETITKLQYLLQNTLYTYAEIVSSLDSESSNELNDQMSNIGLKSQVSESDTVVNLDSNSDEKVNNFINDKIERLGILNDQIQANVDSLPDSSITREKLEEVLEVLNSENDRCEKELESLFTKYDEIYNKLKQILTP